MQQSEIENDPFFKRMIEKMRETEDYQKIEKFKKGPEDKAKIIYKIFSSEFIDVLLNEHDIEPSKWPPMDEYLKTVFTIENVEMQYFPEIIKEINKEKASSSISHLRGSVSLEKKLPAEEESEKHFAPTIIIPQPKIERESPIKEGRTNISYITKKQHRDKLEAEHTASLNKKMFR